MVKREQQLKHSFHKNDQAFYNVIIEKFNQSQDYNDFEFFSFLVRGKGNWMKTFQAKETKQKPLMDF